MTKYELAFDTTEDYNKRKEEPAFSSQLSDIILIKNILWFIQLRFIVIAVFTAFGFFSMYFPEFLSGLGIISWIYWPFAIALVLLIANIGFWVLTSISSNSKILSPSSIIWLQIYVDLLTLTAVIHFTGSTGTPAPFLYVIHIALSCIFFKWRSSLLVTLLASAFYISCIILELAGILPSTTIIKFSKVHPYYSYPIIWALAVIAMFLIVWFIVSRLSFIIRMREKQLISIQVDLKKIQKMKDQYAIQMTHQLKSPLDAMRSSIILVTKGYYGEINKELKSVMDRIELRAKAMGDLILDVLRLARLLDPNKNQQAFEKIDLSDLINKLIEHYKISAEPRGITFDTDINPADFIAVSEQIQILLSNLISNAVNYSYDKGVVTIKLYTDKKNNPVIIISDNGIGVPEDKLPNIFNEYFKTKEAMKHNITSTGIGLSMVRRVAEVYKIRISVTSELGKGTTFTLHFPAI